MESVSVRSIVRTLEKNEEKNLAKKHLKRLSRSLDKLYNEAEHKEFESGTSCLRGNESQNNNFTFYSKDVISEKFKRQNSTDYDKMKSFLTTDLNNNMLKSESPKKTQHENVSEKNEMKLSTRKKINNKYENSIIINIQQNPSNLKVKTENNITTKDVPNVSKLVENNSCSLSHLIINGCNLSNNLGVNDRTNNENEEKIKNNHKSMQSKDNRNISHKDSRLKRVHTKNWSNEKQRAFIEIKLTNEKSIKKEDNNEKKMNKTIENNLFDDKRTSFDKKVEVNNNIERRTSDKINEKLHIRLLDSSPKRHTYNGSDPKKTNDNNKENYKKIILNKNNTFDSCSLDNRVIKNNEKSIDDISYDDNIGKSHFYKDEDPHNYQAHTMSLQRKPKNPLSSRLNQTPISSSLSQLLKFPSRKGLRRKVSCKDLGKTDCKGWLWRLEQEDEDSVKDEAPRGSQSDDEGISNQSYYRRASSLPRLSKSSSKQSASSSSLLNSASKPPIGVTKRIKATQSPDDSTRHNSLKGPLKPQKEGEKRSVKRKWIKNWFLLISKQLYCFIDQTAENADLILTLTSFKVSPFHVNEYKKFAFKLWNTEEEYILASDRLTDMSKWMNKMALSSLTSLNTEQVQSDKIAGFYQQPISRSSSSSSLPSSRLKESQEDLSKMCQQINDADVMIDGSNKLQRRSTILKGCKKPKTLQLLSHKRTLKDKEAELREIEDFLSKQPITSEILSVFLQQFQHTHPLNLTSSEDTLNSTELHDTDKRDSIQSHKHRASTSNNSSSFLLSPLQPSPIFATSSPTHSILSFTNHDIDSSFTG